jgi:hypothetical protein
MLKAKVTADEYGKLDAAVKSHYTEKDGSWILVVEPVDGVALEDVTGLRSSLERERAKSKDMKSKLDAFGDVAPEAAADAIKKVGEMAGWTPEQKVKEQIELQTKQVAEKWQAEVAKREGMIRDLTGQLEENLITAQATGAIAKAKGRLRLLLPHVKAATKLVKNDQGKLVARVIDEKGTELISRRDRSDSPMSIEEFVESLRGSDDFAGAFDAVDAGGSGSGGGGGGGSSTPARPGSNAPKRIPRGDQDALNAHAEDIAKGTAIVVD